MSLRTISRWLFAIGCVGALPLYAQTTATTSTATTKTETHVTHKVKTEAKETKAEEKKETKVEEKAEQKEAEHKVATHRAKRMMAPTHLVDDASRLAAILNDSQTNATVSPAVWKTTANEANSLANKVVASSRTSAEKKAAREARTHVREMHAAAMKGDDAGAKSHAGMALPYVYQVIDAATK